MARSVADMDDATFDRLFARDAAAKKLSALRALMSSRGLAAYVVGTEDAHNSELVPRSDARREFLSGFTGSAGTAVVTHDAACLWTDGRYFLQARLRSWRDFNARFVPPL